MQDTLPNHRIKLDAIRHAVDMIDPIFLNSPQYNCSALSEVIGCNLTLKIEFTNPIRCFKGRGASFLTRQMIGANANDKQTVITASAGNWGQALAYTCQKEGLPIVVYAACNANPLKIERMKALGAEVRLFGDDYDAAKNEAKVIAKAEKWRMLIDGVDVDASVGAGTIAVELLKNDVKFDHVVIPLGGGALLTGMARWIRAVSPETKIIGVCANGADVMEKSWRNKTIDEASSVDTIADGIAIRVPAIEALRDMDALVDDVLLVSDKDIIDAISQTYQSTGHIVEPAGVAGVAAIMKHADKFRHQNVATVLCGSNISKELVLDCIS